MVDIILNLESKVNNEERLSFEEAMKLSKVSDLEALCKAADRIREKFNGNVVDLCTIMNAKSGKCSENCKYCAQSSHYKTSVDEYSLVGLEEALKLARENELCGVNRFSLVTSGRGLSGKEFEEILRIYEVLRAETKLKLCASLGILNYEQLLALNKVGVTKYHHNIEASRNYFNKICTTHSYEDRINTIENAKKAGMTICSGGIIGMGESLEDRVNMMLELSKLQVSSIPINVLNPIKGTPLEGSEPLEEGEILRTIALFRFINPKAFIRFGAGRNFLREYGKSGFTSGINATITGNYLTTSGNNIADDKAMVKELGLEVNYSD